MLKRYKINNMPEANQVLEAAHLNDLAPNGFVIVQLVTMDDEVIAKVADTFNELEFAVPVILTDVGTSIYEVIDHVQEQRHSVLEKVVEEAVFKLVDSGHINSLAKEYIAKSISDSIKNMKEDE